jgi:hypothetical protein
VLVRRSIRLALIAASVAATATAIAVPATASPTTTATARVGSTIHALHGTKFNVRTSGNWFGYVQGTLEKAGNPTFKNISGIWTVPTASQHVSGQAENSSTWIGIGGGCVDINCLATDNTLIQAGTEQDVAANGSTSYYAWYEIIPAPSLRTNLVVHPGDRIKGQIGEPTPGIWNITLTNLTTGGKFHTTLPYSSTNLTAEWVDETPLTTSGFANLPNLTPTHFDNATVNGKNANLLAKERLYLTGGSGNIIGAPSTPQADKNGFGDCTWATTCGVPGNF